MRPFLRFALPVAALTFAWPIAAMHMPVDLEQVPVERLVANLEAQAKGMPNNYDIQLNLGRAHSMAYARKSEVVTAARLKGKDQPQYPYVWPDAPYVAYRDVSPTADPAKQTAAQGHLKAAVSHFEKAIAINPDPPVARINRGWCLEQLGDRAGAIAAYRDVVATETPDRSRVNFFAAAEAIGYLIPLLDPKKDADEIATLRQRRAKIESIPRPVTPIAVPMRRDLTLEQLLDDDATVIFDADGLGRKGWTWIRPDAAWLVYDQIGRGEVGSGLQLFGSVTFWMFWDNGYAAMRTLDDNLDGQLAGGELRNLGLWRDDNCNGVSERGEVRALAEYDIVSLSRDFVRATDADYTAYSPRGVTFRDGHTRPTWDVVLQPAK